MRGTQLAKGRGQTRIGYGTRESRRYTATSSRPDERTTEGGRRGDPRNPRTAGCRTIWKGGGTRVEITVQAAKTLDEQGKEYHLQLVFTGLPEQWQWHWINKSKTTVFSATSLMNIVNSGGICYFCYIGTFCHIVSLIHDNIRRLCLVFSTFYSQPRRKAEAQHSMVSMCSIHDALEAPIIWFQ